MSDMFVEVTDHWGATKQKRRVRASPKNPSKITRMNEAVFQWFKLQRSMNLEVDNGQLCDKALMYSQILKVSLHFTASRGWLTRFKERHGISDIKSTHCKIDSDKIFVSHLKSSLRQENLTPGQVYCVDESVLLWRCPPPDASTLPNKSDKLTLITCTNMDATHKLSLNILGPYPEPLKEPEPEQEEISPKVCTASTQSTDQPAGDDVTKPVDDVTAPVLLYRTGNSHELTTDIFTEWFYSNFVPQVKESLTRRGLPCKAVLIMDNSIYHPDNLSDPEGCIKAVKIPCYVANKSLPSASISRALKSRFKIRCVQESLNDEDYCSTLTLRRCFEMLKEGWNEVDEITTIWKHWYQIEQSQPLSDPNFVKVAELLPQLSPIQLKQWYMQDERPAEVPFRILNELELLEIASQICNERLMSNCSPDRETDKDVRSMIELTSDMRSRDLITSSRTPSSSPPSYQETVTKPHITIPDLAAEPPEKRQRTGRGDLLLSSMKPVVSSLHPQNIIDNILRASLMTQQAAAQIMTSQNHNMMASQTPLMMSSMMETLSPPPFSPLSPNSPDTWPGALQALLGITSVKPKLVSKNDALMGLDKFIAFVEQQQNVAAILKDVLYEYRKYAMHKL